MKKLKDVNELSLQQFHMLPAMGYVLNAVCGCSFS